MYVDVNRELDRLLAAEQQDPYQVLGCQVIHQTPLTVVVRAFQPQAASMRLLLGRQRKEMYRMREAGLFEIALDGTMPESYQFEVTYPDKSACILEDPYRFPCQLPEFDRYLFNNGTHYELYNKLGAHRATIDGVEGVIFRVWAPYASRVSVLGDFNDWDGRVHQMRCLGTSGVWEIFLPGVARGEPYKFEIRSQEGIVFEKADPFQFYAELRPKSASLVWDLEDYQWQDAEWLAARSRESISSRPLSVYEVHLGSWQRDPANPGRLLSFRELADKLIPYAKDMGFTHLNLLPVMEHVRDDSWGFLVTGYFAPTSRYGTPQDFMYFIDTCHQHDLGVILDWVPGHFPTDGHGLSRFDGSSLFEEEGQMDHPEGGKLAFRFERKEVANFLIASALFWLDKFHVDGLRADGVTSMIYGGLWAERGGCPAPCNDQKNLAAIEFLRHLNTVVRERFPAAIMCADEWSNFYGVSKGVEEGGLGFRYKSNREWTGDVLEYFCHEHDLRKFHHNLLIQALPDVWSEKSILPLSHKEVVHGKGALLAKMPGDKWQQFANLRLLYLLLWTQPGKKQLFMGSEFAQLSEWYSQVSLDWHLIEEPGLHQPMQQFVKELNRVYLEYPALWDNDSTPDGFRWQARGDAENSILVYARFAAEAEDDHLVCLFNFTPRVHHDYPMGVPALQQYREILCSDASRFGGSNVCNPHLKDPFEESAGEAPYHVRVSVPPLGGVVLQPVGETKSKPR